MDKKRQKEGMAMVREGDEAPDFELPRDGGGTVRLADFRGGPVVVYFYPRDDTPGCTKEAIGFTALAGEFGNAGAQVIGVSPDPVKSHDRFKAKHDLNVILASDEDRKVIEAYGVWVEKRMYGKSYMGAERATFLIGGDGKVARAWRKVKAPGHAEAVLEAVKAL